MHDYEQLGLFYLGRPYDLEAKSSRPEPLLYDSRDLVTHAVCVGMTGSGKTGLCLALLEEAAIDGIPAIVIDPKGDLGNLLLAFPNLSADEFRPWIDEDEARRQDMTPEAFAAAQAALWKRGLEKWDQTPERIAKLRAAVDVAIYTPGSAAGLPLSIVRSFAAPPQAVLDDEDLLRERVGTTATSLLGLVGIDADPIQSREHILLSTLFDQAWRKGEDLDLPKLIQLIQSPPVQRVGVLELEAFFPAEKRFGLAMALNNLLAAPGFSAWMDGEPMDVQRLLFTPDGRPRIAIVSIAHLNDRERMFVVSLLLTQVLGWMRTQSGTPSLRAIVYMDEIAGYLPPVANPPSKAAMLTLMKQARAFGVGMVLATQNPVDMDHKALSNAGTWFVGRLQTERDQARIVEALEGAISQGGGRMDRAALERTLSGLGKRVFLLHNVHEDAPAVFETRWVMSYLRGPLTRAQIRTLTEARGAAAPSAQAQAPAASAPPPVPAAPEAAASEPAQASVSAHWVLPPGIRQYFAPGPEGATYVPMVVGAGDVRFTDAKIGVDVTRQVTVVTPLTDDPIPLDWKDATPAPFAVGALATDRPARARFRDLPAAASREKNYAEWEKAFSRWLSGGQTLDLLRSPSLRLVSAPDEAEGDFRARLAQAARERRDADVEKLRQKFAPKVARLEERLRRAAQKVEKETQQASDQKVQTAISFGATMLGALFGRKTVSLSTVGRATTAARGVGRTMKESQDIERAKADQAAVEADLRALNAELEEEIAAVEASYHPDREPLETVSLAPKRGSVHVQLVALVWIAE